ncbi:MAG: endopeptidase La [Clostridia bacterium]|nr:endopeptidase La [Clostridia bacterium]MBQ9989084.1 endopeptidase La [Clostridia bacterium]
MPEYPLLPLRGITVFPFATLHFDVGRAKSLAALSAAMDTNQELLLVAQKNTEANEPVQEDVYQIGTICRIRQVLALPGDNVRVLVEGVQRARILAFTQDIPFVRCEAEPIEELNETENDIETEAAMHVLMEIVEEYANLSNHISRDTVFSIGSVSEPARFADVIASDILQKLENKQTILETIDPVERMGALMKILQHEVAVKRIEKRIGKRVRSSIDKSQREFFLREQIKAIQKELGEKDTAVELEELRQKTKEIPLSDQARERVLKEIDRLSRMQASSPEATVSQTYIDTILDMPWGKIDQGNTDLEQARRIFDEDHYGLEKVKERIIEYLAVCQLRKDSKGPILCLVGPPGTGKTSIAKSVARALGRAFTRVSLGGVHDEAEIRGHRRTYIGAVPGNVITGLHQAGSMNPVFLFDEIDKLGGDFRGDPASAMLEVLDPEQNKAFRDHYLDIDFDLSKVLFITTANETSTIARPLLDRMEVIEVPSYTSYEKIEIARRYLVPKQIAEHGIGADDLVFEEGVLDAIVQQYTAESGVRSLERQITTVCRKVASKIASGGETPQTVTKSLLREYLGLPRVRHEDKDLSDKVGVATGLAWTMIGGTTLQIETSCMPGTGKIELTGQLGDVMKESARTALSYLRAHAKEWKIDPSFYKKQDLHIHIPEGATPKDGPSAGVTLATSALSALSGLPIRGDIAMTGEITLTGRVLPVGGIREKTLAALRENIHTVIMPRENEADFMEIDQALREQITVHYATNIQDVFALAVRREDKDAD